MAQTFNNGESNASVRTKLNANATELNSTTTALAGKATPEDIETALDNATIFFDEGTFEGKNFPVPIAGQPAVGTLGNPIKAKNSGEFSVVDVVALDNMAPVTSNAVAIALTTLNSQITGGSDYTIADLYELIINGSLAPEITPTNFVVDNINDTADFTFSEPGDAISNYEYKLGSDVITTATVKPIVVGNNNFAIGSVKIRKKGRSGLSSPSSWLTNPIAYTEQTGDGNYLPGFTALDILSGLKSGDEFTSVTDHIYSQETQGNLNTTLPYHMPNGAKIAFKIISTNATSVAFGLVSSYELGNIRGLGVSETQLYRKYFTEDLFENDTVASGDHVIIEFVDPNNGEGSDNAVRQCKFFKTSDGGVTIVELIPPSILNYVNGYEQFVAFAIDRETSMGYPQQFGCILDTEV